MEYAFCLTACKKDEIGYNMFESNCTQACAHTHLRVTALCVCQQYFLQLQHDLLRSIPCIDRVIHLHVERFTHLDDMCEWAKYLEKNWEDQMGKTQTKPSMMHFVLHLHVACPHT
jgi:hypothetical protein